MAGIGSDMLGGPKMITIFMAGTAACIAVWYSYSLLPFVITA